MTRIITTHHRAWDFVLAALGLYVLSFGLAILGGWTGARVVSSDGFFALGLAIVGMLVGYFLGIVAGLVVLKIMLRQPGSLLFGLLALVIWTGVSIGITAIFSLASDASSAVVAASFLITPVVALLGYYFKKQST